MPVRPRRLLPALAFAVGACGFFGGEEAPDSSSADSTGNLTAPATSVQTAGGDVETGPPTDLDERAAPMDSGQAVVDADGGALSGSAAGAATGAGAAVGAGDPNPGQVAEDQVVTGSLDERLEQIIVGQQAINQRLDSLVASDTVSNLAENAIQSGQEVLGEARDRVRNFGVGVIWSIVVLALFNIVIRATVWLLDTLSEQNPARRLVYKRLVPIVRIVLWIFAAYLIVRVIFQVDYQGFIAAAAVIGVAVGLAAQDLLKNLFGGLILVFDQPFQVGDKVSIGGTYGEVVSIGLRSTRIVTPDDNRVTVPNAQMIDQQVANANSGELNCQVVTDLYLPGWADEQVAKRIAFSAAASSKYVYLNKPIVTLVSDVFKETFLTRVRVKAYVLDPRLEFLFQSDVTERARAGFREAGLLKPGHMWTHLVERSAVGIPAGVMEELGATNGSGGPAGGNGAKAGPDATTDDTPDENGEAR